MLRKLLKQDIRSTWREFGILFLCIFLAGMLVPATMLYSENPILLMLSTLAIFAILVASMVISIMCLFRLFNSSIYSNQGYLTMTLPATGSKLVLSKLITGTGWITLTTIVGTLCFLLSMTVYVLPQSEVNWNDIKYLFYMLIHDENTGGAILCCIIIFLMCVVSLAHVILQLYLCCSIAHQKVLKGFRVPLAVIAFFVINWLEGKFFSLLGSLLEHTDYFGFDLNRVFNDLMYSGHNFTAVNLSMVFAMLIELIPMVLIFLGTVWMVNNRLELE